MIDDILNERQKTHGDFKYVADIAQELKGYMRKWDGWHRINTAQAEALEMIASKIGRILSGNPNEPDHWRDIAGYATLALNACSAASGGPTGPRAGCSPATPAPVPPAFVVPGRATLP